MNKAARHRSICRYALVLLLLLAVIQRPPFIFTGTSQNDHIVVLNLVNLRLGMYELWSDRVYLTRYAPHSITSSIYPTDPTIEDTIVYVSLLSDEDSTIISNRGDSPWLKIEFMPLAESYTLEVKNNGQLEEVFINVSIVQEGPGATPTFVGLDLLATLAFLFLLATVIPLVALALSIAYYRNRVLRRINSLY